MPSPSDVLLVASPGDERVVRFQAALAGRGAAPARLVPWTEAALRPGAVAAACRPGTVLRLDSPGKSAEAERALIAAGAEEPEDDPGLAGAGAITRAGALQLPVERGRLRFPRQWYRGLRATVARIHAEAAGAVLTFDPGDIARMFDKRATDASLREAGVPVAGERPVGHVSGWEALRHRLAALGLEKVFVKLAHGSSAAGVMALRMGREGPRAFTTVERVPGRDGDALYNTRAIRLCTGEHEVAALVDALAREGVQVEPWLPKATIGNRPFDLRVLALAAVPRHTVVRMGRTVITNLQAGGRRGELEAVAAKLGPAAIATARAAASRAARVFPRSLLAGVDVLLDPAGRAAVLEVNAFGDLLRDVLDRGEDPYEAWLRLVLDHDSGAELPCPT